jgi:Fe-S cluster assembly protein SufD
MVNLKILNNKKKDLKNIFSNLKDNNNLEIRSILGSFIDLNSLSLDEVNELKRNFDLFKTKTKNYKKIFNDIDILFQKKKEIVLKEDCKILINGIGEIDIYVIDDINLKINYSSNISNFLKINFYILDNVKLNLREHINEDVLLFKEFEYYLSNSSKLIKSDYIYSSDFSFSNYYLNKNSELNLKGAYLIENKKSFIRNNIYNLDEKSVALVDFNGAGKSSEIINDILIRIEKDASNSKGIQKTQNIILDEKTKIYTEPILEINNSNVECSHGNSTYEIDKDILYYMQSRGISKENAVKLIVEGFFEKLN